MSEWPFVLGPAILVAITVRVDALLIGPYFALSSIVGGNEGVEAIYWYEKGPLGLAFIRRLLYPALAGFVAAWTALTPLDIASIGLLAAGLLLWPIIFHGLPWFVPRRTWHLPVLYGAFLIAYVLLALGGRQVQRLLIDFSDGDVKRWISEQLLASLIIWACGVLAISVFRRVFTRTRDEALRREEAGAEATDEPNAS